jgi:microsomal epoxide hydrolase
LVARLSAPPPAIGSLEPFEVDLAAEDIEDLRARLDRTRWPDTLPGVGWTLGADLAYVRDLCDYWRTRYDWRAFHARMNAFPQFLTEVDGQRLHFIHARSPEPNARPLILSHGWPGSTAELLDVIGPLSDPRAHGGDPRDAFHVVAPSLPGYGFSGPTTEPGWRARRIAAAFGSLMSHLGYDAYFAHGGDKGVLITLWLAASQGDRVTAVHTTLAPASPPDPAQPHAGLQPFEIEGLERTARFLREEMAYQQLQRTKPQTAAFGLTDSPAGLAAWIVEKFHAWSDCDGGDLERAIPRDRLVDGINVYWFTRTIASSMRLYWEDAGPGRQEPLPRIATPFGHAQFPAEIIFTPRSWAEQIFNVARWTRMPRGGHFPALEAPTLLVEELRSYFRLFRGPIDDAMGRPRPCSQRTLP